MDANNSMAFPPAGIPSLPMDLSVRLSGRFVHFFAGLVRPIAH
jgi:hypothetical protein